MKIKRSIYMVRPVAPSNFRRSNARNDARPTTYQANVRVAADSKVELRDLADLEKSRIKGDSAGNLGYVESGDG